MKLAHWAAWLLVISAALQGCAAIPAEDTTASTQATTASATSTPAPAAKSNNATAASIIEKNKQSALALLDDAKKQNRKLTPAEVEAVLRKLSVCSPS